MKWNKIKVHVLSFMLTIFYCSISFSSQMTEKIMIMQESLEYSLPPYFQLEFNGSYPPSYKTIMLRFSDGDGRWVYEQGINIHRIKHSLGLKLFPDTFIDNLSISLWEFDYDDEVVGKYGGLEHRTRQKEDLAVKNKIANSVIGRLKEAMSNKFDGFDDGIDFGYYLLKRELHVDVEGFPSIKATEIKDYTECLTCNPEPGTYYIRYDEDLKIAYEIIIYLADDLFINIGSGAITFMDSTALSEYIYNSSVSVATPHLIWRISKKPDPFCYIKWDDGQFMKMVHILLFMYRLGNYCRLDELL